MYITTNTVKAKLLHTLKKPQYTRLIPQNTADFIEPKHTEKKHNVGCIKVEKAVYICLRKPCDKK